MKCREVPSCEKCFIHNAGFLTCHCEAQSDAAIRFSRPLVFLQRWAADNDRAVHSFLPNSTYYAIIPLVHGIHALALPVCGRRGPLLFAGGGRTSLYLLHDIGGGDVMVTYSDLFQLGILIVSIISLVLQINKKK